MKINVSDEETAELSTTYHSQPVFICQQLVQDNSRCFGGIVGNLLVYSLSALHKHHVLLMADLVQQFEPRGTNATKKEVLLILNAIVLDGTGSQRRRIVRLTLENNAYRNSRLMTRHTNRMVHVCVTQLGHDVVCGERRYRIDHVP